MKKIVYIVSHTHWDREWYLTREVFRTKLVRLLDGVLDIVENDDSFTSFMMDGQAIAIEDYLEVRPENKQRLTEALRSGKVICGPWYVLPDELLISGESHIRNYLIGSSLTSRYGKVNQTGYLPDSFGHPAQMPQIISGLGLEAIMFWRGVGFDVKKSEFLWYSPDKAASITALNLPCGYGNVARLKKQDNINLRLSTMIEQLLECSTTDTCLLMNGSDHIVAQGNLSKIIEGFNKDNDEYQIKFGKMDDFVDFILPKLSDLQEVTGELRSGDRSMLLGGTLSTRMYLKQYNSLVERQMERYLEPLNVISSLYGIKVVSKGYSDYIWKKILENHPHDSICGCSIDEVHSEMMTRFACTDQLENEMISQCFEKIETSALKQDNKADAQILIFEPTTEGLESYVEIDVDLDKVLVQEVNFAKSIIEDYEPRITHQPLPENVIVKDEDGNIILSRVISAKKDYSTLLTDETAPQIFKVNRLRLGLYLSNLSYGLHTLYIYKDNKNLQIPDNEGFNNIVENEFYTVEYIEKDSSFKVKDKETGKIYENINRFINMGDAGDEYTYSWPCKDEVITQFCDDVVCKSYKNNIYERLVVKSSMAIPSSLTEDRKSRSTQKVICDIQVELTIYKGSKRIDFKTIYNNKSKDNRLQVSFPSGVLAKKSKSSSAFAITSRDIDVVIPENWMEYPQSTHPTHGFVSVGDDTTGICVASKGLYEYEAVNEAGQTFINLTLLRCVGWLSRVDLLSRKGNGGWTIETPEAQCIGVHEFEYSIMFKDDNHNEIFGICHSDRSKHEPILYPSNSNTMIKVENHLGFLSQLPPEIRLSTVKEAENGKGIIVRIFSVAKTTKNISLNIGDIFKRATIVDLKEDYIKDIKISSSEISISVNPSQIISINLIRG